MPTAPTLEVVTAYLPDGYTDEEILDAYKAEKAAQARVVRFPSDPAPPADPNPYPDDLATALKIRVHRHLALKPLPLRVQASMSDGAVAVTRIGRDPEVRRLEAPFRRTVLG